LNRRDLLKLIPAAAAAQNLPPPEIPQKITQDVLHQALSLAGLEFTSEQEQMMLTGINRNLANYENLRKIDIPRDTEPATRFYPTAPRATAGKFQPRKIRAGKPPANIEDLAFATVTEIAPLIKARRVSSVELTRMCLARLKRYSPKLNCVITLTEDLALARAEQADHEIRHGKYKGPLHGIPCGVKDLFATKGIPTTWGAEPFQNQVFDYDSAVVEKLRAAGSPLLAKLSMGALAQGGLWFGGMTKTPWNLEQTSSGSSAGSASSTAAGLVGFSVGTETLGSIVSPATRCGVTGLRPTYGRVSRFGAMGLSWTMDKIGPICRSVEDCALVLQTLRGSDGRDLAVVDAPFDWQPKLGVKGLRVGVIQSEFDRLKDDMKKVLDQALADLRSTGTDLKPVELPKFDFAPLRVILSAEAATAFDDLTRNGGVNQLKGQTPGDWPNSFRTSQMIPAVEYIRAQRARTLLMREMDRFMANWDVLVSPPFSAGLTITNLTGHPQVAVPCGFVDSGLPTSLLFTGHLYEEGALLRAALAFEKATKWHTLHPKVDWS
jgi:Asp-tRNA(Asn)/Glu-tRNA(Gln) amidotransferase A subunit family amidase/Asp-tRNA(Asn)/Glu-tRNA(Gln) amidotransferase C subunit